MSEYYVKKKLEKVGAKISKILLRTFVTRVGNEYT